MTTVAPSPGNLSQLVAGTDGVWPTLQLGKHMLIQVVCLREGASEVETCVALLY